MYFDIPPKTYQNQRKTIVFCIRGILLFKKRLFPWFRIFWSLGKYREPVPGGDKTRGCRNFNTRPGKMIIYQPGKMIIYQPGKMIIYLWKNDHLPKAFSWKNAWKNDWKNDHLPKAFSGPGEMLSVNDHFRSFPGHSQENAFGKWSFSDHFPIISRKILLVNDHFP